MVTPASITLNKGGKAKELILLEFGNFRKIVLVLRSLNHKIRQIIIKQLEDGKLMTVTELHIRMRLDQSIVSQHLAILRRAGVLNAEKNGKYIYYSLNKDRLNEINLLGLKLINS